MAIKILGGAFVAFAIAVSLASTVAIYWVIGSTITSAVKAVSKDCGKKYGVEESLWLSGEFFCASNS